MKQMIHLKRFGFTIHSCIGGFSSYYKAITNLGRTANTLRMELGTENTYCEELQIFFIKNSNSFLYAASTRNQ